MKIKRNSLVILILICISSIFLSFEVYIKMSKTSMNVYVDPNLKINQYKNAYVDIISDGKKAGNTFIANIIDDKFEKMGFKVDSSDAIENIPNSMDLLVNCYETSGWGSPVFGRHFRIHFRFRKSLEIELIDAQTKTQIAKVSYKKGFNNRTVGKLNEDVEKVFDVLKKQLIDVNNKNAMK